MNAKSYIILFSTLLLFIGVKGVDVIKHICPKDGVQISLMFDTNDHCEMEKTSCCSAEKEKSDCCDDEYEYFQVKLDYSQEAQDFVFTSVDFANPFEFEQVYILKGQLRETEFSNTDPPVKERSQRLSEIQVYII